MDAHAPFSSLVVDFCVSARAGCRSRLRREDGRVTGRIEPAVA